MSTDVRHPASLLVVRLGAMGDVIHAVPAVVALRSAFPEMRIGWLVEERWAELLCAKDAPQSGPRDESRPLVDSVHVVDTKRWRKSLFSSETRHQIAAALREVRNQHYEAAVDFQGAIKSAVMARLARTRTVIGMRHPREWPARMLYAAAAEAQGSHVIDQYHSLAEAAATSPLTKCPAVFARDDRTESNITKLLAPDERFVLINPGAGWGAKQWPPERYGEVAKGLTASGLSALINFGPREGELVNHVVKASGGTARPVSCSLGELIALTRRAVLFIGGDTGPLHLASALRVPVVAIFGPTDPVRNGPYGTRSVMLRNPASRTSLSHTSVPDPGLLKITADEVIAAARQLLEAQSA